MAEATSDFHTHGSTKYPSFHTINAVRVSQGAACLPLCLVMGLLLGSFCMAAFVHQEMDLNKKNLHPSGVVPPLLDAAGTKGLSGQKSAGTAHIVAARLRLQF